MQNQLKQIPLSSITVNRPERQRKEITPSSVFDLAKNIAVYSLLQNIGVSKSNELLFGERRFTAFQVLNQAAAGIHSEGITAEQFVELQLLITSNPRYDNYSKIPTRISTSNSPLDSYAIEFIENTSRKDLSWQERSEAAWKFHNMALRSAKERSEQWSIQQSADALGINRGYLTELIEPHRQLATASEKTKARIESAVKESASARAAVQAISRIKERHGEQHVGKPTIVGKLGQQAEPKPKTEPKPEPKSPIICVDFHEWAASYEGEPFNFLHCDFPYGIDFNTSGGQNTSADVRSAGAYDDCEEVYWSLLATLAEHQSKLIAESAHIMFWYSQNLEDETKQFIREHFPIAKLHKFKLIWHCSDNSGLLPSPNYEGRRTYETAFQISFGNRKISKAKALLAAAPRNQDKIHRSQKPLSILSHFFEMFVDTSSRVFDPTCGSGTSLIAAKRLKAASLVGLEIDPEMAEQAKKFYGDNT